MLSAYLLDLGGLDKMKLAEWTFLSNGEIY